MYILVCTMGLDRPLVTAFATEEQAAKSARLLRTAAEQQEVSSWTQVYKQTNGSLELLPHV